MLFEGKSVKDKVFNVLSEEWPLSARKIFFKLKGHTYQAVYKVLQELVEQRIVKKQDQQYFVNIKWLNETIQHLEALKQDYRYRQGFLNGQFAASNPLCFDRRIAHFVEKVGPKVQDWIKGKCCILAVCGNIYGLTLKQYLDMYKKIPLISIKHDMSNLPDNMPENVIVVDFYIHTGGTYKRALNSLRDHPNVKNICYVVEYDMLGLADFSAEQGKVTKPLIDLNVIPIDEISCPAH